MAEDQGNGARGNGKARLDELIRSKEEELKRLHDARRRWEEGPLAKSLEKSGERREDFETLSGLETDRIYTPEHVARPRLHARPRLPRRVSLHARHPADHVPRRAPGRSASTPASARPRRRTSASSSCSRRASRDSRPRSTCPTQMGLDSDDERAAGEVGQVGVAIDSLADMETVFDGIPLDRVSTSMTINAPAPVLVAMYVAVADKQGVPREKVSGTAQNDVLKEYVARGTFIYPPKPSLRLAADLIAWCASDAPRFNAISLSGLPHARGRLDRRPGDRLHVRQRDRLHRGGRRARRRRRQRSRRGCRGSSTPTSTSSRRSPSTARCGACGRGS